MTSHQTILAAIVAATGFTNDQSALHAPRWQETQGGFEEPQNGIDGLFGA